MRHVQSISRLEHGTNGLEIEIVLVVNFFEFVEYFSGGLAGGGITRFHSMHGNWLGSSDKSA